MKLKITTITIGLLFLLPLVTQAQLRELILDSGQVKLIVTPDAGGRVLFLGLPGHPNFLKTGEAVKQKPLKSIDENTPFIPYFGHEVWFGPQSQWWTDQTLLPKRKKRKFAWPPDPFSSLSVNRIVAHSTDKIVLESPPSPVNGLTVKKSFALVEKNPSQIDLWVTAKNSRQQPVSWDIWFNSRTFSHTRIFVPIAENVDVGRLDLKGSVPYTIDKGLLSIQTESVAAGKKHIQGKILFQPAAGWFAAFNQQQLLIVQFPLLPLEKIHPEQGQLEFYLESNPADVEAGVLEMEVHSAYTRLQPGEEMQAHERWTLVEYTGDESVDSQRKFLMEKLSGLKSL